MPTIPPLRQLHCFNFLRFLVFYVKGVEREEYQAVFRVYSEDLCFSNIHVFKLLTCCFAYHPLNCFSNILVK